MGAAPPTLLFHMIELNIKSEKNILQKQLNSWYDRVSEHLLNRPNNFKDQLKHLSIIRKDVYEDLNQLQHKGLIIEVAEKLQNEFPQINKWTWHPMQTSHNDFADLTGYVDKKVFLNAEVTTSLAPVGTIAIRMENTLLSLNKKQGKLFYFVQSEKMLKRAETKTKNNKLKIEPRQV